MTNPRMGCGLNLQSGLAALALLLTSAGAQAATAPPLPATHPITVPHVTTPAVIAPTPAPAKPKATYIPPPIPMATSVPYASDPLAAMYVTPVLTPEERKTLAPSALARRLFEQLADTIIGAEATSDGPPVAMGAMAGQYKLYGASRGSNFNGMCQAPVFAVDLINAGPAVAPETAAENRPVRASITRGGVMFKVRDIAALRKLALQLPDQATDGSACARLTDVKSFFAAGDVFSARLGVLLLDSAIVAAQQGATSYALNCTGDVACASPRTVLAGLDVASISVVLVGPCPAQGTPSSGLCAVIQVCDPSHPCTGLEDKRLVAIISFADNAGLASLFQPDATRIKEVKLVIAPALLKPAVAPAPAGPPVQLGASGGGDGITNRS